MNSAQPLPDLALTGLIGRRPMVAVLPFTAVGGDRAARRLGGEIAEALRERLENDPALQAILINSEFLSKAPPHALELVCRELRVGHVISGKCHGDGPKPSLYLEVADTRDWHIRWANFYRQGARALLADEDNAMTELVAALRGVLVEPVR